MKRTLQLYSFGWRCAPRYMVPVWLRFTPRSPESYSGSASPLNDESDHRPGGVLLPKTKSGIMKAKLCVSHTLQPRARKSCVLSSFRSKRGLQETVAAPPHLTKTDIDDKHYVTC